MRHLLLGGRGVLGSGFREVFAQQERDVVRLNPPWGQPAEVVRYLESRLPQEVGAHGPCVVVWAAGVGSVGASAELLREETEGVRALGRAVASLPPERARQVSVVFASSAGALFGGHGSTLVGQDDVPTPISPYGREKLVQEQVLRETALSTGCRVVVCRISNVYGLADGRVTQRGLVSTAVRATRLRQPMTVFVSPDTRRDYVYNVDAAAMCLQLVDRAGPGWSQSLVRDGTTRTVSSILALVGAVSGRRVPASYGERPETRLQPPVLRFVPPRHGPDEVRRQPMEAAVHLMLRAPLAP